LGNYPATESPFGSCHIKTYLTIYGRDTANLRWQNKDFYGIDIKITEEQFRDSEIYHTTEVVGYMVFAFIE